jgi:hypothetical protein
LALSFTLFKKLGLRQWLREIGERGFRGAAFIAGTIHRGHRIPVTMATLDGDITIRR